jgi:hypothetical protein
MTRKSENYFSRDPSQDEKRFFLIWFRIANSITTAPRIPHGLSGNRRHIIDVVVFTL